MLSAVFYGKGNMRTEQREIPEAGDDDVLIRVHACGICGTDLHIMNGDEGAAKTPAGTVLGHEFAGEVVDIGRHVTGINIGDRVSVDPNRLCGKCDFCRRGAGHFCTSMVGIGTTADGGFSEYAAVPSSQVYKVSDDIPYETAAMCEPLSCCLHGIELCSIQCGSTVAVIGCGMIGLLMIQLVRQRGAAKIIATDIIEEKRKAALRLGADIALEPSFMHDLGQIDTVIECAGKSSTIEQAIAIAGVNSVVMMFGLTSPDAMISVKPFEIFKKEINLRSSYINPYTFGKAVKLIESGRVDVSSFVYAKKSLHELPGLFADKSTLALGKHIIVM